MQLAAISIDLNTNTRAAAMGDACVSGVNDCSMYDVAVERVMDWAKRHQIPLTLFAVGADVRRPHNAQRLALALEAGHEVGNLSLDHLYDLSRRSRPEMFVQVKGGADLIAEKVGQRPCGFRAPGYVMSDKLYDTLVEADVSYSSSLFPCPVYTLLESASIGLDRLRGRRRRSLLADPRVVTAPSGPYRVGDPYWKPGAGVLELPVQTTPWLRLPFTGTSLTALGRDWAKLATEGLVGQRLVNLKLHAVDFLDAADGVRQLEPLLSGVRRSAREKMAALDAVVVTLKAAGYDFVRLQQAAERF